MPATFWSAAKMHPEV